jgi:hypothetical protein
VCCVLVDNSGVGEAARHGADTSQGWSCVGSVEVLHHGGTTASGRRRAPQLRMAANGCVQDAARTMDAAGGANWSA